MELQNTVKDLRSKYSQLGRTVKLGCGKLLGRFLRLRRCYAAKKKELKQAQAELVEATKIKWVLDAHCRRREEVVALLMAEKEELRRRCEEFEGKVGEREQGIDMLLSTNED